jgi:hypothetical protein
LTEDYFDCKNSHFGWNFSEKRAKVGGNGIFGGVIGCYWGFLMFWSRHKIHGGSFRAVVMQDAMKMRVF